MTRILMWLEHKLNPLHVYCRLNNNLHICKENSMSICKFYEKTLFVVIFWGIKFTFKVCQFFGLCKEVIHVKNVDG